MKFVIHYHETEPPHYDFMFEQGDMLATWRVMPEDMQSLLEYREIRAVKIQNHRKKYLNYEGPISCDRGMVSIHDSGSFDIIEWSPEKISLILQGDIFNGRLAIRRSQRDYRILFQHS